MSTCVIKRSQSFVTAFSVLPLLRSLSQYYPGFEHWYVNTVVPGIVLGQDLLLTAVQNDSVVGLALGKKTQEETKLRCVRVMPTYQDTGLGIRLIDAAITELKSDKPHCTVAEELLHTYSRIFVNRYGFQLSSVDKGRYRRGKLEYAFN